METINLVQGSAEWKAHRAKHFNASDSPAMMGVSKHKSRDQLLHELATGIAQEVNYATQQRFEEGHRIEILARPLAEKIIGADLYPVVGVMGEYSASFDGITMDETVIFEHKSLNVQLSELMANHEFILPICYRIQMEQQLMVSGAKKCLFMASKWIDEKLVEEFHCWHFSDLGLRKEIDMGWIQFKKDLSAYVPRETVVPPKAASIMALPTLAVAIKGEVTLSNLPEFKEAATAYIAQISTTFVTDEDFSNGDAAAKFCKNAEDNIELTKKSAIAQTASIDELMRTLDFIKGQLRDKRLIIEKLVLSEKEARKLAIINEAADKLKEYVLPLTKEVSPIILMGAPAQFANAVRNKKTLLSMQSAVNDELARAKIEADAIARDIRTKLAWYKDFAVGYEMLFADLQLIINKPMDDFQLLVRSRINAKEKDDEAKYQQIKARAEAEAIAKVEADQRVKAKIDENAKQSIAEVAPEASSAPIKHHVVEVTNMISKPKRPTDDNIIAILAMHFRVHESSVIGWLLDMDLNAASERMATEFKVG